MQPVLKYPGAKWRIADWIISHMPAHTTYLEPFFGSGAIFFNKKPSTVETINDVDDQVVNFFKVLRDQPEELSQMMKLTPWARNEYYASWEQTGNPLEDARRFMVKCWQAYGARLDARSGWRHEKKGTMRASSYHTWLTLDKRIAAAVKRLRACQIENMPAVKLIRGYNYPGVLIYADPPYPLSTRGTRLYAYEMTDTDHMDLLDALDDHPGPVLLSGYACDLYDKRLKHWRRETIAAAADGSREREEVLWVNRPSLYCQISLFD